MDSRHAEDAVSPVIGVILMVAIVAVLAGVIGGVLLGLDDSLGTTAPRASFTFDYDPGGTTGTDIATGGTSGTLTIVHTGGDDVPAAGIEVVAEPGSTADSDDLGWSGSVSAGDSVRVVVDADATVRLTYVAADGSQSATLATWRGPDA
jgi:FlaG/FlaF family flagellin (archaellin)